MNTVKLQGLPGQYPGIMAKDLLPGDIILWNFGYTSKVVKITPSATGKTCTVWLESHETGCVTPRKMGANRLVAVTK